MMKKKVAVIMVTAFILCALSAAVIAAGNCGCSKCVSTCGKCQATDMFQAASDWNDSFNPKPCILQPMKPWETVKAEQIPWFQGLADSINKKCPPAPRACDHSCGK